MYRSLGGAVAPPFFPLKEIVATEPTEAPARWGSREVRERLGAWVFCTNKAFRVDNWKLWEGSLAVLVSVQIGEVGKFHAEIFLILCVLGFAVVAAGRGALQVDETSPVGPA